MLQPSRVEFGTGAHYQIKAQDYIQLWELLSEIKMLNRLTVQTCTTEPFGKNDTPAQYSFFELVQKFVHLENFHVRHKFSDPCLSCTHGL